MYYMSSGIHYQFSAAIWKHSSPDGWYFVSLPRHISKEIRKHLQWQEEGWGRMKATVEIEDMRWKSSIWFDTKHDTYLLPVKSSIRKKAGLEVNKTVDVNIWV